MNYIYDLDNSCNNIVIEYIRANDKKNSMKANHYHDFYEFYFYLGDDMTYFINNRSYRVGKYDLVFINKDVYHRTNYKSNEKERILIMFREEFFDALADKKLITDILQILSQSPVISFDKETKNELYDIILRINLLYKTNKEDIFSLQIALIQFLLSIKDYINKGFLRPNDKMDSKKSIIISDITDYINGNYSQKITLEFLMNKFYIDKYHLCHVFKKITGMTVIEFINNKRLAEAKGLLKSSDYSMSKISSIVGFQNQNHFNTLFKRTFNQTPSQFKNSRKSCK